MYVWSAQICYANWVSFFFKATCARFVLMLLISNAVFRSRIRTIAEHPAGPKLVRISHALLVTLISRQALRSDLIIALVTTAETL